MLKPKSSQSLIEIFYKTFELGNFNQAMIIHSIETCQNHQKQFQARVSS